LQHFPAARADGNSLLAKSHGFKDAAENALPAKTYEQFFERFSLIFLIKYVWHHYRSRW
jgi:hypothetical protein